MQQFIFIYKKFLICFSILIFIHIGFTPYGLSSEIDDIDEDELNIGGNIFSDFSQDLEAGQVMEDERFYRYSRFYGLNFSFGITNFTGNRGNAYTNFPPSLGLSLAYFMNFQTSFGVGVAFSKHSFLLDGPTQVDQSKYGAGLIEVNLFRSFFFYRYYLDTFDLGTAITFSNPYFVARMEYWNIANKFVDKPTIKTRTGGAFGGSLGLGLEFPIKIKESFFGLEALYHFITLPDSIEGYYRPVNNSNAGFNDLTGSPISVMFSYVISW